MSEPNAFGSFEEEVVPLLDPAYNLARWLTRNEQDAMDIVQESYVRAFRAFSGFRGGSVRPWLLKIVRNTFYTWLQQTRHPRQSVEFDEQLFGPDDSTLNPEEILLQSDNSTQLRRALGALSESFREVLILRELEEMSYQEISEVTGMPVGTVMSRLSRGRDALRQSLADLVPEHR